MYTRRLARFGVMEVSGVERLIAALKRGETKMKFFVTVEELHGVLEAAHVALGHGGKNRMLPHLKEQYKNVTEESILLYLSLCGICLSKKTVKKRGITVKPMVFNQSNDRWQIDLVDWQTSPDGDYKWICNIQDHLTKFTWLRPLTSKRSDEVARNVLPIMLCFGAPSVLQSDNGREFCNEVIKSLMELWPELKMVHGESPNNNHY
jgi:hypothetical protein